MGPLLLACFYLAVGAFIFLLGLSLLRMEGAGAVGRSAALILFFCGLGPVLSATGIMMARSLREGSAVYTTMVENFEYLWEFYFPSLLLFAMTFPKRTALLTRHGWLAGVIFLPHLVHLLVMMAAGGSLLLPGWLEERFSAFAAALPARASIQGIGGLVGTLLSLLMRVHRGLFSLVDIFYSLLSLALLIRSTTPLLGPNISAQLRTIISGVGLSTATYIVVRVSPLLLPASPQILAAGIDLALVTGGGSIGYAVVRQQLLGVRNLAKRCLLYGSASLAFAVVYLVVVKPVSTFFGAYSVGGKEALETGFVIITIIAFQPILARIEQSLASYLMKEGDETKVALRDMLQSFSTVASLEELEGKMREAFVGRLGATKMKLVLFPEGSPEGGLGTLLADVIEPIGRRDVLKGAGKASKRRFPLALLSRGEGRSEVAVAELEEGLEIFAPIRRSGTCIGYIALGPKAYQGRYDSKELAMISLIAGSVGVAVENVRLMAENVEKRVMEEELATARKIQMGLLPSRAPKLAGYELEGITVPSKQVGGDYFDFLDLGGGRVAVVVADISGKGMPASLLMASLRAAVRSNQDAQLRPSVMLSRINRLLVESTSDEQFATLIYLVLHGPSGELVYANAGHNFPILIQGGRAEVMGESDLILGCSFDHRYSEQRLFMPSGSFLALYTDGFTEASRNGVPFGEERLKHALFQGRDLAVGELSRALLRRVREFAPEEKAQDDMTLVLIKRL